MPTKTTTPVRNIELAKALAADGRPRYIVAGEARVNGRLISEIVAGRVQPSPEVKTRLARVLKVPEQELFED